MKKKSPDKDLAEVINAKIKDLFLENGLILTDQTVKFLPPVAASFTDSGYLLAEHGTPAKVEVMLTFAVASTAWFD
jgi:hypothetical protein